YRQLWVLVSRLGHGCHRRSQHPTMSQTPDEALYNSNAPSRRNRSKKAHIRLSGIGASGHRAGWVSNSCNPSQLRDSSWVELEPQRVERSQVGVGLPDSVGSREAKPRELGERRQGDGCLQPRKWGANTEMDADPEGEVTIVSALDVEQVRLDELLGIAVRRP